jgi:DNA-binding CsgD family transcriptional regulator/N-acetylneuraminic acid mutarotase
MTDLAELSDREREILYLVASGASNKEIASTLYISTNTVKVHLRNIFSKIGANSRTEAAMYAITAGLVELPSNIGGDSLDSVYSATSSSVSTETEILRGGLTKWINSRTTIGIGLIAVSIIVALGIILGSQMLRGQVNAAGGELPTSGEPDWQANAPLPTARKGMAFAYLGNQIYIIGGDNGTVIFGKVERYEPALDSWLDASPKPTPVTDIQAAVIGGKIYVPGGRTPTGEVSSTLDIYDPETDTWMQGKSLPFGLSEYALVTFEGKIYLFGGWDGENIIDTTLEYSPEVGEWFIRSPMPTARSRAGAAVAGGKALVFGGFDGERAVEVNEAYFPANEGSSDPAWESEEPMPSPRSSMGVAVLADIIHVIGGIIDGNDQPLPSLQYSGLTNTWQVYDSPLIGTWKQMGMGTAGTHLYLIGGELNGTPTTNNLSFQAIYLINLPVIR